MPEAPYAWAGTVAAFLETPEEEILQRLTRFARETGAPQLFAWDRSVGALRRELGNCVPAAGGFGLVLEFELHRSGGRRPDLILLENGVVIVVEFKNRVQAEPADLDQVLGYVRNLADYHAGCRGRTLIPVLVPVGMSGEAVDIRGVRVVPPEGLGKLVRELARSGAGKTADATAWTAAPYEPLPALVDAARLLFERQPLPRIRRAESARIPEAVDLIETSIRDARTSKRRLLVLVTGVPGSGKTLVGLQVAHSRTLGCPSIFLSGNGPLVQVLQYSLKSREFVQDMRSYLREHLVRDRGAPRERVLVFDEAQRAWDRDRVLLKHQGTLTQSEPELLLRIAARAGDGFGLVALMGEGQEIHAGEEAGIGQWAEALRAAGGWEVLGPPHLAKAFDGLPYRTSELLHLTTSLRTHRASDVALWIGLLLDGRLDEAGEVAVDLRAKGFAMWMSRNLDTLRDHVRGRFSEDPGKRTGLLASSKFRKVDAWGVEAARQNFWYYGPWFEAPASDPRSGSRLELAISEFGCQGLELDLPILCWGPDLIWDGLRWEAVLGRARLKYRDPRQLRLNAYRVLLTRGREGVTVFVPPEPAASMDPVFDALRRAGFQTL